MFLSLIRFCSLSLFPYPATSHSGLEVTPGPINHSNQQQQKQISQMKHLFCSASEPLHSPPSISLLPLFFIRLLMVYKLHIMVPPLPCAKAFFFYGLSAFVREKSYKWEPAAEAVKLWAELMKVKPLNCDHLLCYWTALWLPVESQLSNDKRCKNDVSSCAPLDVIGRLSSHLWCLRHMLWTGVTE